MLMLKKITPSFHNNSCYDGVHSSRTDLCLILEPGCRFPLPFCHKVGTELTFDELFCCGGAISPSLNAIGAEAQTIKSSLKPEVLFRLATLDACVMLGGCVAAAARLLSALSVCMEFDYDNNR